MKNQSKYMSASKYEKSIIINTLVENTGLHRKSIIRRLHSHKNGKNKGGSKSKYLPEIKTVLELVWKSKDYICAELLHSYLNETVNILLTNQLLSDIPIQSIEQVSSMPLGTLKLKLRTHGIVKKHRFYTRSGKENLQRIVSVFTAINQASESRWLEVDFVNHNGGDSSRQFARTLCTTDIFNQYIIRKATKGKIEEKVQNIMQIAMDGFPFKFKHLHSDNEQNLLNSLIMQQARRNNLGISRSRSYQKQDNRNTGRTIYSAEAVTLGIATRIQNDINF